MSLGRKMHFIQTVITGDRFNGTEIQVLLPEYAASQYRWSLSDKWSLATVTISALSRQYYISSTYKLST